MQTAIRIWWVLAALVALTMAAPVARGQDEPVTTPALLSEPADSLKLRFVPMPLVELEALLAPALKEIEQSAYGLAEMIRIESEMSAANAGEDRIIAIEQQRQAASVVHADLVQRIRTLMAAIETKGGDVSVARMYVDAVSTLTPASSSASGESEGAESLAEDASLDAMVAEIQAMPPVHQRSAPWTVSVEELTLELQPLQAERIAERVEAWKVILGQEVRKRIRIDIALQRLQEEVERGEVASSEDTTETMQALATRSQEQQVVVALVAERARAAVSMLEARGEDVSEHRRYINKATGQRLAIWNPRVLWSQLSGWALSPTGGQRWAMTAVRFVGVLVIFWVLSRIIKHAAKVAVGRVPQTSELLQDFVTRMVSRIVMLVGFVAALAIAGVPMGWALGIMAGTGLVIGLALQGTLSNFASGLLILLYRPFDVGNVVTAGGVTGKVEKVGLFTTTILTFDNQVLLVPNNEIWSNVITNSTTRKTRRVDLVFGVAYSDDLNKAQGVLEDVVSAHEKVLTSPAPVIRVNELADNSVNFVVRPWVKTADYWDVYWDLMRTVKDRFDAEGLNIPFPQRDLHVPGAIEVKLTSGVDSPLPETLFGEPKAPEPVGGPKSQQPMGAAGKSKGRRG